MLTLENGIKKHESKVKLNLVELAATYSKLIFPFGISKVGPTIVRHTNFAFSLVIYIQQELDAAKKQKGSMSNLVGVLLLLIRLTQQKHQRGIPFGFLPACFFQLLGETKRKRKYSPG